MKPIILILLTICFIGCNTLYVKAKYTIKDMPKTYNLGNDSTNSSLDAIKLLFKDSSLVALIDSAILNNLDIQIASQRIIQANAYLLQNRGNLFPTLTANGEASITKFGKYTSDGAGNRDLQYSTNISNAEKVPLVLPNLFLGAQMSWEADIWGKLSNSKKSSYYRLLSSIEGKNALVSSTVALVSNLYYDLLALDYELEIVRETIVLQNNQLAIIKLEKQAGKANELAVQQFESQVLNYQTLEIELVQKVINYENQINYILGRYPQPIKRSKAIYLNSLPFDVSTGVPAQLLQNRPDIKAAEMQVLAAKLNVQAAKKAFYPKLYINGVAGFQSFNAKYFINPESFAYSMAAGLVAPLINKSALRAEFQISKSQQEEALMNYQKTILNGYIEVNNQLSALQNLKIEYDFKLKEVELLTKSIETVSELYLRGRASYLEILFTRKTALQSNLELIEIKKRQYEATVAIYRAIGGGWR